MNLNQIFKRQKYEKQRDFENRAKQFYEAYRELVQRFKCDWAAHLECVESGKAAVPKISIIDATERIEAEEKAEKQVAGAVEKQRLEGNQNQEKKNGN